MKKPFFLFLLLILLAVFPTDITLAQRSLGGPPPPPPPTVDALERTPTDMPFDGGLSLIAIAGAAYAAKKGYNKRKTDGKNRKQ